MNPSHLSMYSHVGHGDFSVNCNSPDFHNHSIQHCDLHTYGRYLLCKLDEHFLERIIIEYCLKQLNHQHAGILHSNGVFSNCPSSCSMHQHHIERHRRPNKQHNYTIRPQSRQYRYFRRNHDVCLYQLVKVQPNSNWRCGDYDSRSTRPRHRWQWPSILGRPRK